MEARKLINKKKIGIVIGILIIVAMAVSYFTFFKGQSETKSGIPLYPGASKIQVPGEVKSEMDLPEGTTWNAYKVSDSTQQVSSWYEEKMMEEGWTENSNYGSTKTWLSLWKKESKGAIITVFSGESAKKLNIPNNGIIIYTGNWKTLSQEFQPG
ncbi:hypothetical protein AKJ51_00845 [candidate division MSBL1 archaeon SCGC-AAA382A20]|uniref:Uncharacterized protein n=1 Tax=candidate division MSBL1 archaeon SCGC-AAA382A20 TaxID=1698280 RepID=A0A133VMD2_9EURY|nr:hypothetical protein AKJ51_00845 [candidate division MSBL1 archaeon SCGC-AAA382A20]